MASPQAIHADLPSVKNFDWNVLGFGLCRMWITQWMLLPLVFLEGKSANARLVYFSAMVLACLFVFFFSQKLVSRTRGIIFIISFTASVLGIACLSLGALVSSTLLFFVGLLGEGIGAALLQILWGDRFTRLSAELADFYTVCAMLFGSALSLMVYKSASLEVALFLQALVPLASFILLARCIKTADEKQKEVNRQIVDTSLKEAQSKSISFGRLCASIFVFVFIFNFAYRFLFSGLTYAMFGFPARHLVNLCVMIVLFVIAIKTKWFNRLILYRASFPILIGALLLFLVTPKSQHIVILFVASFGYRLFEVLFWCLLVNVARQDQQRSWKVLCLSMLSNFAGMGLGMYLSMVPSDTVGFLYANVPFVTCMLIFLLVVIFILILPESLFLQIAALVTHQEKESRTALENTCEILAEKAHLSPRETEVLILLAQGHTQDAIASKLVIGKGTAHSHILHVYQKLGVHSRQEIIDLVASTTSN